MDMGINLARRGRDGYEDRNRLQTRRVGSLHVLVTLCDSVIADLERLSGGVIQHHTLDGK
jgi:hypothetical protein